MGIVFVAFSVENSKLEKVHREPALIWRLYAPEEEELYLSEIGAGEKLGLFGRLLGKKTIPIPSPLPVFSFADGEREEIDLDKSWDGINFCLKLIQGDNVPNVFEDGKPVGKIEVGYGPAMTFDSKQVQKVAISLEEISDKDLLNAYKPNEMKKVYPEGMWSTDEEELKEYLIENYLVLKQFILDTNNKNMGICVVYS